MNCRYVHCDVFTERRFGGNPLAVIPDARGLSAELMQAIAREFNFSETTFVLPPERGHTRRVRIFTPSREIPFAGHPNVGTAFVLAAGGELGPIAEERTVVFEELAGLVPVTIRRRHARIWCELAAPEPLSLGREIPAEIVARALDLEAEDIAGSHHAPQVASVGLPFVLAELGSRRALERARIRGEGFDAIAALGVTPDVLFYVRSADDFDVRARMFAPAEGVPEDPATGSANCALAALLHHVEPDRSGVRSLRIAQGVEMGRPSVLETTTEKRDGKVVASRVGGDSVWVAEGELDLS